MICSLKPKSIIIAFFPILCLAAKTGMRSDELYALTWGDVDFERNLMTVSKQWKKKDGLVEWTQGEQSKVLREFCKTTNIKEVKFHDLRATFITNMLSQGIPLVKVMSV